MNTLCILLLYCNVSIVLRKNATSYWILIVNIFFLDCSQPLHYIRPRSSNCLSSPSNLKRNIFTASLLIETNHKFITWFNGNLFILKTKCQFRMSKTQLNLYDGSVIIFFYCNLKRSITFILFWTDASS